MTKAKDAKPPRPKRAGPATKTNPTTGAFQISDELWEVLAPLIPQHVNTHRFGGGRPRVPDRTCANGIFYVLRTGCQWKALDATGICSGSTAHLRFQEWVAAGVFLELWRVGLPSSGGISPLNLFPLSHSVCRLERLPSSGWDIPSQLVR